MSSKLNLLLENRFLGHKQAVYSLQKDGFGGWYSAGSDGWIVHWESVHEQNGRLIAQTGEPLYSLYVFGDLQEYILAGGQSGTVYAFRREIPPKTGDSAPKAHNTFQFQKLWEMKVHEKGVFDFKLMDDHWLISCSADGRIAQWNMVNPIDTLNYSMRVGGSLRCFQTLNNKDGRIFTGGFFGNVYEWLWSVDLNNNRVMEFKQQHGIGANTIFQLESLVEGYAIAGRDAKIWLTDNHFNTRLKLDAHWFSIHALSVSPNSLYLASGSMDKSIRIWDVSSGNLLVHKELAHRSSVNKILWISSNEIISCSDDAQIISWKLEN